MAKPKLTAPVGRDPRTSEGDPVKNKPADVQLVRKMLEANGIGPLGDSKKADAGLLKAIKVYQKKIGFKWPDQVIDPGGKTITRLLPKYMATIKKEEPLVEVKYRGKILTITAKDHEALTKDVFKRLTPYMKSLLRNHKNSMDTLQDYLDTAMMKDGVMNAVTQAIIMNVGSVKMPNQKVVSDSIKASGKLERAMYAKSLAMLDTALPEAEKAINAFNDEIGRFLKDFTGSAQMTATTLSVTSATCFAVVGALAAPVLVTGAGMSAAGAAVTSGAGVGVLQSASQELGKHASGQKVTPWESVRAIVIDGTIGGLTGGIGAKIPLGFCDDMAKAVAPRLASKVPWMATQQLEKYIANFLSGSGQEAIKGAINEAIKLLGSMMKSGKVPTEKEFNEAVSNALRSALLGGLLKNLGSFQKKWTYKHKETLQGQILPDRFAHLAKKNDIPNVIKAKMYADVMNKVSGEALKVGYDAVIKRSSGSESDSQLTDLAAKAIEKDRRLQVLIDKEFKKALKKHMKKK